MRIKLLTRLLLTCSCLMIAFESFPQPYYNQQTNFLKANSQWAMLNTGIGLNFNSAAPPALFPIPYGGHEGVASVADPVTGAYLFYSPGYVCYNANNQIMLNSDSLLGNTTSFLPFFYGGSSTQGVCIVPFIDRPGMYYLFSLCGPTNYAPPGTPAYLYYSVVDMSLDGGLGGIVPGQKNIPLGGNIPLSESMIAIPGNNCDIWLMVHDLINPVFKAFHITRQGLDPNPVVSTAGTQLQGAAVLGAYAFGGMAVTPNRGIIGIASNAAATYLPGLNGVLLCKFDPETGVVGASVQMEKLNRVYGLAFSPDNTKLYLKPFFRGDTTFLNLRQYDISIFDSAVIAASRLNVGHIYGDNEGLFLKGYNGKIYTATTGSDSLGVINQPNLSGMACSFGYLAPNSTIYTDDILKFPGGILPNDVVYPLPPDTLSYREDTTICAHDHIFNNLNLAAPPGYYGYAWDDGSTSAIRTITAPGIYWVLCKDSCHSLIDSFTVTAKDIPLSLGPDTALCSKVTLQLDATVPGGSYLWQDNSTNSTFAAAQSGSYWVKVVSDGCTVFDTIKVSIEDYLQDLGTDFVYCKGDQTPSLTLQANVPPGAVTQWSTGSQAPTITISDTGSYWVTVADDYCTGTDTIHLLQEVCACFVELPTAFSPNGDGLNDTFLPIIEAGCPVRAYVLNIYNRYGQRVYSGYNADNGWDGLDKGSPAEVGTYMYEMTFTGGTKQVKHYRKGDLTLIR